MSAKKNGIKSQKSNIFWQRRNIMSWRGINLVKNRSGFEWSGNCKSRALVVLLFALLLSASTAWAAYSGGSGTAEDPYQISTPNDMNTIGTDSNDWDKHFLLTNDIDMSTYTGDAYNLIGYWDDVAEEYVGFSGVFDGNGHIISNFTYDSTGEGLIGLFSGVVGPDAEIKDLGLTDPNVSAGGSYAASLVGYLEDGTITSCYVDGGSIAASGRYYVGGLIGRQENGVVTNCHATCTVSGGDQVGGLVGFNSGGTISKCFATGSTATMYTAGGLVGSNLLSGTITNSYATGSVIATVRTAGGLVGRNTDGTISNCYATGSVSGDDETGGLVAVKWYGTVSNCYSIGNVSGTTDVGGLLGKNTYGTVTDSFWDKDTSGMTTSAGGTGKTTAQMQTRSTFTSAGWDFTDETANGTEDIWRLCVDGTSYPLLAWQTWPLGDYYCPDGSDFKDYAVLAGQWRQAPGEPSADIAPNVGDGIVDGLDLKALCVIWQAGAE
jgi:hypothetical protein